MSEGRSTHTSGQSTESPVSDEELDHIFSPGNLREGERSIAEYFVGKGVQREDVASSAASRSTPTSPLPGLTMEEIIQLYPLPRAAMVVYQCILLWCLSRCGAPFTLPLYVTRRIGISHDARTRALLALQHAGYIRLAAAQGRAPVITVTAPTRETWLIAVRKRRSARKRG